MDIGHGLDMGNAHTSTSTREVAFRRGICNFYIEPMLWPVHVDPVIDVCCECMCGMWVYAWQTMNDISWKTYLSAQILRSKREYANVAAFSLESLANARASDQRKHTAGI